MYILSMARTLSIESVPGHADFRALRDIRGIAVDLRYASASNFVGTDLYAPFDCAWIHREAGAKLEAAAKWLQANAPGRRLLVLDALRPQRVQQRLWDELAGTPLCAYLADPARGSIHSFGMAVDVTLTDAKGREIDMGTPFDDMSERSHPVLEESLLAGGELTRAQVDNRRQLRMAMEQAGWRGISREWWHFDAGDRERIRAEFLRVL
jgi:D-alanyl-D-alanine dipeptidase